MLNFNGLNAKSILIPMDNSQKNHLKSYGIVYNHLKNGQNEIRWCLNYLGGSFIINYDNNLYGKIISQGITCTILKDQETDILLNEFISSITNISSFSYSYSLFKFINKFHPLISSIKIEL